MRTSEQEENAFNILSIEFAYILQHALEVKLVSKL